MTELRFNGERETSVAVSPSRQPLLPMRRPAHMIDLRQRRQAVGLQSNRSLDRELAFVSFFRRAVDNLENELANRHARNELYVERSNVPHLQLKRAAGIVVVPFLVTNSRMYCWAVT